MKYLPISALLLLFTIKAYSQENNFKLLRIECGYTLLGNQLNGNNYYDYKTTWAPETYDSPMGGVNLKFATSSKFKNIDLVFGAVMVRGLNAYRLGGWTPGYTTMYDISHNGGGVYFGVSPRTKGKYIGLTSEVCLGVFSFKEYIGIFNNVQEPFIDVYDRKASYGLGAMSSIGFYINLGRIGVSPSVSAIFSGGANTSFLFYGATLPLTITF